MGKYFTALDFISSERAQLEVLMGWMHHHMLLQEGLKDHLNFTNLTMQSQKRCCVLLTDSQTAYKT
jgi:hypothetical protein